MTSISSTDAQAVQVAAVQTKSISTLSKSTKSELEAYGITATDGMSEAEARQAIQEAKAAQAQEVGGGADESLTETEILSDAKSLADKVGVSYSVNDDISNILDNIGVEIENLIEEAQDNPAELSRLVGYYQELTSLDAENDLLQNSQNGMYAAMNMVSTNNRISLGLE